MLIGYQLTPNKKAISSRRSNTQQSSFLVCNVYYKQHAFFKVLHKRIVCRNIEPGEYRLYTLM